MILDLSERAPTDLIISAGILEDNGYLPRPQDVIDFFEKPWKWADELEEIGELLEEKYEVKR